MSSYYPLRTATPDVDEHPHSPWRARDFEFRPRRPWQALQPRRIAVFLVAIVLCVPMIPYLYAGHSIVSSDVDIRLSDDLDFAVLPSHPPSHFAPQLPPHQHIPPAQPIPPTPPTPPTPPPPPATVDHVAPEPLAFSFIMFSTDSASEGAVLMKSILMYSSRAVDFHIICDEDAQTHLESRLRLLVRPAHNVRVWFYRLTWDQMIARIQREGAIVSDHSAGAPGLMKLFIHEILPPTVKRSIFIDTDAFFITDPALLWQFFDDLNPDTAISMPTHPDQSAAQWHHANRICSCIMLLNLEKLRALRLMDSSLYRDDVSGTHPPPLAPPAFEAMYGPPGVDGHYQDVKLGDQGYWWAIVAHRPDIFQHLSYEWEVSSCLLDMYRMSLGDDGASEKDEAGHQIHTIATPHEGEVILPKMLHFNCLDGTPRYYEWEGWTDPENSLTKRWSAAVSYHVGFKWLWLNRSIRDSTNATLEMETVRDIQFADEIFALHAS